MLFTEQDQLVAVVGLAGIHVLVRGHGAVVVVDGRAQLTVLVGEVIQDVRGFSEVGQVDKLGEGHVVRVDLGVGNWEHDGIGS